MLLFTEAGLKIIFDHLLLEQVLFLLLAKYFFDIQSGHISAAIARYCLYCVPITQQSILLREVGDTTRNLLVLLYFLPLCHRVLIQGRYGREPRGFCRVCTVNVGVVRIMMLLMRKIIMLPILMIVSASLIGF
jgi:hypothetical protein